MHHEKTRLYQVMLQLVTDASDAIGRMPRGSAYFRDQLTRASSSVPMLFSEGARRRSPKDRAHYFDMSAGSARECSAIADSAHAHRKMSDDDRRIIKDRCDHVCAMLHKFR